MTRWVGLLQGINVGNRTMKMAELKTCLEGAGFANVRTVLASGNFIAEVEGTEREVKARAEAAMAAVFDFPVQLVVRAQAELQALADADHFKTLDAQADLTKHVLLFDAPLPAGTAVDGRARDTEILAITEREILIAAYRQPNGRYTENIEAVLKPLYAALGKSRLSTMRNWNTIEKLLT